MTELGITMAGAALAVLGGAALWAQRRRPPDPHAIRLVASRPLGGRRFLAVVEVDGERLLLGVSDAQVTLVARLGDATGAGTPVGS